MTFEVEWLALVAEFFRHVPRGGARDLHAIAPDSR